MAKLSSLLMVQDLAIKAEKEQAIKLTSATYDYQKSIKQLASLKQYRQEYNQQFTLPVNSQVNSHYYHRLYKFVFQLDEAITQHMALVTNKRQIMDDCQKNWLAKRQYQKMIETLVKKHHQVTQSQQNKIEQQLLDEFSTQQFIYRNSK